MEKVLAARLERILSRPKGSRVLVEKDGMEAVPFALENFYPNTHNDSPLYCIDGGNATLLETPELLVGIMRVACVRQVGMKTSLRNMRESLVIIHAVPDDTSVKYEATFDKQTVIINPNEAALRDGIVRCKLGKALEVLRRVAELQLAKECSATMDSDAVLILDGELDAKAALEKKALKELLSTGKNICGVVKAQTLITDQGASLNSTLREIAPPGAWHYWPLVRGASVEWVVAKLCDGASQCYRVDLPASADREKVLGALSCASEDLSLPGYPYGLVVADQHARMGMLEAANLKARLLMMLSKETKLIEDSYDTHEILNKILVRLGKR